MNITINKLKSVLFRNSVTNMLISSLKLRYNDKLETGSYKHHNLNCSLTAIKQIHKEGKKYLKASQVPGRRCTDFDVYRKNISLNGNTQDSVNSLYL